MTSDSPKFTAERQYEAAIASARDYISRYYIEWRLVKVLTNQKILNQRYEFYRDLGDEIKKPHDINGEAVVSQDIKHGLYFDSIAHCVQYVEDIFAFLKAMEKPVSFINNIITYDAGKIMHRINNFKLTEENVRKAFYLPSKIEFADKNQEAVYNESIEKLITWLKDIIDFYKDYVFHYNQYKHGLAVGMRPFGGKVSDESIQKDKEGNLDPTLIVYDNRSLSKGKYKTNMAVVIPSPPEVAPFTSQLEKSGSLFKGIFPPHQPFKYKLLVEVARKARTCLATLMENYFARVINNSDTFIVPNSYKDNLNYTFTYKLGTETKPKE